jgi:hypothetical protein
MHAFLKQARQPPCSFFRRDGTPRCDTRSCLANGGDDVRWDMSNLSGSVEVSSCGAPVRPALELEKNFILHACFRRPPIQPLVVDYSLPTTAAPLRNWPAIVHVAIVAEGLSVSSRYASRPYRLCPPTARHDPPSRQTFRPLGSITTLDQTLFQFPSTTLVDCCTLSLTKGDTHWLSRWLLNSAGLAIGLCGRGSTYLVAATSLFQASCSP